MLGNIDRYDHEINSEQWLGMGIEAWALGLMFPLTKIVTLGDRRKRFLGFSVGYLKSGGIGEASVAQRKSTE